MIDLHYWTTPNGHKVTMFLEETGLAYKLIPVNIGKGEQFKAEFLAISPNNRIPALVDHDPPGGGAPIAVFESGAMLVYLAEKTGKFLPKEPRPRAEVLQWLFWQMGGLGPMAGQAHHFRQYAPAMIGDQRMLAYGVARYTNEVARLYRVLDGRLQGRDFVAGEYTIADMAIWPWVVPYRNQGIDLEEFPEVRRWFERVGQREAVQRGRDLGAELRTAQTGQAAREAQKVLFGQRARA